jgi:site-specific DNA recombinase
VPAERYDDCGFTGANIDRPAFQRLMADVDAVKVDVIVVYKVDRLSRSLLDFVKVMERLNTAGASFVSITQNFSTADAMGRLTMNMLMSFAEFEREMISKRTRDKIAGARRKGKWTGGPVPFGYSAKDKKLFVNEAEAHVVRDVSPRAREESANAVPRGLAVRVFTRPAFSARTLSRRARRSPTRKPSRNQGRKGNGRGDRSQGPLLNETALRAVAGASTILRGKAVPHRKQHSRTR